MSHHHAYTRTAALAILAAATLSTGAADIVYNAGTATPTRARAMGDFKAVNTNAHFSTHTDGRIGRVYGRAFSHGQTAAESTAAFINQHSDMWGVNAAELVPQGPFDDGRHTQPVYYLPETDSYKFTATYYTQQRAGLPVFESKLVLLTRNEAGNPLVLASANLHDLSAFNPDPVVARAAANRDALVQIASDHFNGVAQIWSTERVIYAGNESNPHDPVVVDNTIVDVDGFKKFRILTDATTGEILHEEVLTHTVDVSGNASALASSGPGADICEDEIVRPLPYLNVSVQGGGSSITDVNGDFTISNAGSTDVTVNADLDGQWFDVYNYLGSETSESESGSPANPFDILFNSLNNSEQVRAEVNVYIEANTVRDWVLGANPSYPLVAGTTMDITVNRTDGFCPGNAWYDSVEDSINFCLSGSSNPNTAWSSVVHHEYGHHVVSAGGSGQGQYGEGMGDVLSTIILDDSRLGLGFYGSCSTSLRNATNQRDYPCSGGIHDCGQLISGCYWDTRNLLIASEPDDYQNLLMAWAVNSVLVHTGDLITPQITIDVLTLDDDDSDIGNGTPHYLEIDAGFSQHSMDAPPLTLVDIQPVAAPDYANPNGGTTVAADFIDVAGTLDPSTPTLMVDTGSGFQPVAMNMTSGNTFQADLPGSDCGSEVKYYFTADTTSGLPQTAPADAPSAYYSLISAFEAPVVAFDDNFETNQGWTVSGDSSSSASGRWERAIPTGNGERADPPSDFDGSGNAYVTGNGGPSSNTDVDVDETILTSPIMDASGASVISYARWFNNSGNTVVDDQFYVEVSDNGGSSWSELETLGTTHPESNGGWFSKQFALSDIAGFTPNDQFRIRFIAEDIGGGSIVECGIDAVKLQVINCEICPADLNGDGALDFFDVSQFLAAFSAGEPAADFNGDGSYDFFDVSAFLGAFSAGCP